MKRGDFIQISHRPGELGIRCFRSFPGEYGFHSTLYLKEGSVGILLEQRIDFFKILAGTYEVWIEKNKVKKI